MRNKGFVLTCRKIYPWSNGVSVKHSWYYQSKEMAIAQMRTEANLIIDSYVEVFGDTGLKVHDYGYGVDVRCEGSVTVGFGVYPAKKEES